MARSSFGLVDSSLLEKIDGLFACNAGDYVDLPQLVVVGQQSSGKSSVLEGLTGLPFPRDSGLCTRFATQITFRRASTSKIAASIIPAKDSSDEHQEKMRDWGKKELGSLDMVSFAGIMTEVINLMGVGPAESTAKSAFSKDVLVLEISGPSQEHFSVIDVPGTFKRTTQGLTTKDDIALVDNMVKGYMANPRSVMLVVVPCNADIATQEVVELAEDLDPDGDRTLGILTKPDLVDKGAESDVIQLMDDKKHRLKLGWHLLRNPGQAELLDPTKTRNAAEEAFFDQVSPWNALDKEKVGVESLRCRLQEILATHIRREFPKVKAEIGQKLRIASHKLNSLGPKRQTQFEQIQFLMDISLRFQEIATCASRADYGRMEFFRKDKNLRLATATVNRGETFANVMSENGHDFKFIASEDMKDMEDDEGDEDTDEMDSGSLTMNDETTVAVRLFEDHPDMVDVVQQSSAISKPHEHKILAWLKSAYRQSRGFELGTFASSVLVVAMQQQARKWQDIAFGYINDVISLVHSFVLALLEYIVPNQRVRRGLNSLLIDELKTRYQSAVDQTKFLLSVELEGTPATYNHYFGDTLDKCRQERLQSQLSEKAFSDTEHGTVVRLQDIVQNHPLSNDDHIIREVHDILRSYYKLALKRFVDNVRMMAADHFLVAGPDTPLKLFSPKFVASLTTAQLDDIAGELPALKRKRAELEKEISLLGEGMKILR